MAAAGPRGWAASGPRAWLQQNCRRSNRRTRLRVARGQRDRRRGADGRGVALLLLSTAKGQGARGQDQLDRGGTGAASVRNRRCRAVPAGAPTGVAANGVACPATGRCPVLAKKSPKAWPCHSSSRWIRAHPASVVLRGGSRISGARLTAVGPLPPFRRGRRRGGAAHGRGAAVELLRRAPRHEEGWRRFRGGQPPRPSPRCPRRPRGRTAPRSAPPSPAFPRRRCTHRPAPTVQGKPQSLLPPSKLHSTP